MIDDSGIVIDSYKVLSDPLTTFTSEFIAPVNLYEFRFQIADKIHIRVFKLNSINIPISDNTISRLQKIAVLDLQRQVLEDQNLHQTA